MPKILIELNCDWEDYEDVAPELIAEDALRQLADKVSYRVVSDVESLIEERATGFAEWIVKMGYTRYNKHTMNREDAWLSDGGAYFYKIADSTSDLFKLYLQQIETK